MSLKWLTNWIVIEKTRNVQSPSSPGERATIAHSGKRLGGIRSGGDWDSERKLLRIKRDQDRGGLLIVMIFDDMPFLLNMVRFS